MKVTYTDAFYAEMEDPNRVSAETVVPIALKYIGKPKSLVDVGCGRGIWLSAFERAGVTDILGIDGDYVELDKLHIAADKFRPMDLTKPIKVDRTFDVAVCLEMAEHVSHDVSEQLVAGLVSLAPVILFSAAIPLQGGSHHINEQWPAYWKERFAKHGYVPVDAVRRHVWSDPKVSFFYAQNILIYVREDSIQNYPELVKERENGFGDALPLVHPQMYTYYAERWRMVVPILGKLPVGLLHSIKRLLRGKRSV